GPAIRSLPKERIHRLPVVDADRRGGQLRDLFGAGAECAHRAPTSVHWCGRRQPGRHVREFSDIEVFVVQAMNEADTVRSPETDDRRQHLSSASTPLYVAVAQTLTERITSGQ